MGLLLMASPSWTDRERIPRPDLREVRLRRCHLLIERIVPAQDECRVGPWAVVDGTVPERQCGQGRGVGQFRVTLCIFVMAVPARIVPWTETAIDVTDPEPQCDVPHKLQPIPPLALHARKPEEMTEVAVASEVVRIGVCG